MNADKITEFLLVLVFAMVIGTCAVLSVLYLEPLARGIAIFVLVVATITSWQFLRRRFRRG